MNNEDLLKEFRLKIKEEYLSKGAKSPDEGSSDEKELFDSWLRGKEILDKMKKNESRRISGK